MSAVPWYPSHLMCMIRPLRVALTSDMYIYITPYMYYQPPWMNHMHRYFASMLEVTQNCRGAYMYYAPLCMVHTLYVYVFFTLYMYMFYSHLIWFFYCSSSTLHALLTWNVSPSNVLPTRVFASMLELTQNCGVRYSPGACTMLLLICIIHLFTGIIHRLHVFKMHIHASIISNKCHEEAEMRGRLHA